LPIACTCSRNGLLGISRYLSVLGGQRNLRAGNRVDEIRDLRMAHGLEQQVRRVGLIVYPHRRAAATSGSFRFHPGAGAVIHGVSVASTPLVSSLSWAFHLASPEFTLRTCEAMVQARRAAYSRMARLCIASVLMIIRRDTHIQPGTKHVCRPACLARNVSGCGLQRSPLYRCFGMSPTMAGATVRGKRLDHQGLKVPVRLCQILELHPTH